MTAPQAPKPALLFTAFEPSGDDHAAIVIAELRKRHPDLPIYAWGGSKMEAAGAEVIEKTGQDAVMGVPGLAKIREHREINDRIDAFLKLRPVTVHIPVDSPGANFSICKIARRHGKKIVHLVAPQIWAWGPWRIRKLRRLTDLVLCVLPFEEGWFTTHGVPARFIGHPLFDEPLDNATLDRQAEHLGQGNPRVALMPGSRPAELAKNFPLLLGAYRSLKESHPDMAGVVAVTRPEVEEHLRQMAQSHGGWPNDLQVAAAQTDAVIRWCQLALVVSGTVTLQIAKQQRPMVVFYKSNRVLYHLLVRWVLTTKYFTLPNLIASAKIMPELVPHFGGHEPIAAAAAKLLDNPDAAEQQRAELAKVVGKFRDYSAGEAAADAIEEVAGLRTSPATKAASKQPESKNA